MVDKTYSTALYGTLATLLCTVPATLHAAPQGADVVGGVAAVATHQHTTVVTQSSDRAVINWDSFDIAPLESAQFVQPSVNSATLNRVTSGDASHIMGSLKANGTVVVVNPNGVVFGADSRVNVGSLLATTADINTDAFMQGSMQFDQPGHPDARIVNHGQITAKEAGLVGMVAPHVENNGVIRAKLGHVHLASGSTINTVDLYGDGLLSVAVDDSTTHLTARNSGAIIAEGGSIAMTAAQGREVVDSAIQVGGLLDASSAQQQGGDIVLTGGDSEVVVADATINASGAIGGGTVRIGGDVQGRGTLARAKTTAINAQSGIRADATQHGKGGSVAVWSENTTEVAGTLSARGATAGQGGFVETSGKRTLHLQESAQVDTGGGTWLLDPTDIEIVTGGGVNKIDPSTITTALSSNNVVIHTASGGSDAGHVTVTDSVAYNEPNDLSLLANGNINVNANIRNTGNGDVHLVAGWDGATGFIPSSGPQENSTVDITALLDSSNGGYGNATGRIFVSNAANARSVEISSQSGDTIVAGYDVTLQGGFTGSYWTRIGYAGPNNTTSSGNIAVYAVNDINIVSGTRGNTEAVIGAGLPNARTIGTGNITVSAGGNITLDSRSGGNATFAAIGHNNIFPGPNANHRGDIAVSAHDLIMLSETGADDEGYTQVGHSSFHGSPSNYDGDITVTLSGDLLMQPGPNGENYAMIGHGSAISGGDQSDSGGNRSGNIAVSVNGEISMVHNGEQAYIGHFTRSGDLSDANVSIKAAALDFNLADTNMFTLDNSILTDNIKNSLTGGDVTLAATGGNALTWASDLLITDADNVTGNMSLLSEGDINMHASIQHGEQDLIADGSASNGAVNIIAGWDGSTGFSGSVDASFDADAVLVDPASYGNNNGSVSINRSAAAQAVAVGSYDGATRIAGHDVLLTGGDSISEYAHIGARIDADSQTRSGDVIVLAGGDIIMSSPNNTGNTYTMIGHGGDRCIVVCDDAIDNVVSGDVHVSAQGDLTMSGNGSRAFSLIGHGGRQVGLESDGDISVSVGGELTMNAWFESFRQIGHGGFQPRGGLYTLQGDITINARGIQMANANNRPFAFEHIGHGSGSVSANQGDRQGNITIIADQELSIVPDTGTDGGASIGHTTTNGDITDANLLIQAGSLDYSNAVSGTFLLNDTDFLASLDAALEGGNVTLASTQAPVQFVQGTDWNISQDGQVAVLSTGNIDAFSAVTQAQNAGNHVALIAGWDGESGINDDASLTLSSVRRSNDAYNVVSNNDADRISSAMVSASASGNVGAPGNPLRITADRVNFDADDTMIADIIAARVDIGESSTGASLSGLINGQATQDAANQITGGPGNDSAYRFADFIIRYDPETFAPDQDVPVPGDNTPPVEPPTSVDIPTPPAPMPPSAATVSLPSTVEQVSQRPRHFFPELHTGDNTLQRSNNAGSLYVRQPVSRSVSQQPSIYITDDLAKQLGWDEQPAGK